MLQHPAYGKASGLITPTLAAVAQVFEYLSGFRKYDWLWKEDKDVQYKRFVASNPAISDYEAELAKFMDIESEIEAIPTFHNVGPLTLNTTNLKLQLGSESRQWKIQYSNKVLVYCSASRKLRAAQSSQKIASNRGGGGEGDCEGVKTRLVESVLFDTQLHNRVFLS